MIFSHSANLAVAVQELASRMVKGDAKIALASGIDVMQVPESDRICQQI